VKVNGNAKISSLLFKVDSVPSFVVLFNDGDYLKTEIYSIKNMVLFLRMARTANSIKMMEKHADDIVEQLGGK
jgi:hypothetical protein